MSNDDLSRPNGRDTVPLIQIPSAIRLLDHVHPIKQVLIGSPEVVKLTQHMLDLLRYADLSDWAEPLQMGEPIEITPAPGDVITTLIRYLSIN